ncbi:ATP-binding protein [Hungatella sp.]|uniref:ATP-binding protein n=1 Tax=Hungatella sp. TaxID=2613924 RepID=UPI002A827599|nr:ATP-binding protein [Hungatella sp.]
MGLIDSDGYYTNTALLLSDQCEHSIKCAVFEGTDKTRFKTRRGFYGSVFKQLENVYEYISLINNVHADFIGLERVEHFDYPEYAIREALLNAIVHRDYDYSGSIIINIFDDRIEFVSIGGLVKGITLANILHGVSQSRNMVLANVFYQLKLVESYGIGIQRIMQSYSGNSSPGFFTEASSFVTILPNQNYSVQTISDMGAEDKVLRLLREKKK